jgi:PII-like signaling protein
VVVEIADEAHKIEEFLPELDRLMHTGLIVIEPIETSHLRPQRESC